MERFTQERRCTIPHRRPAPLVTRIALPRGRGASPGPHGSNDQGFARSPNQWWRASTDLPPTPSVRVLRAFPRPSLMNESASSGTIPQGIYPRIVSIIPLWRTASPSQHDRQSKVCVGYYGSNLRKIIVGAMLPTPLMKLLGMTT